MAGETAKESKGKVKTSFVLDEDLVVPLGIACSKLRKRKSDVVSQVLRRWLEEEGYLQ